MGNLKYYIALQIIEMKHLIFYCLLSILVGCKTTNQKKELVPSKIEEKNKITFVDLKGVEVDLADFAGKRILVNFWATWCGPCIKEMPALEHAKRILNDINYVFLFVSDESMEEIIDFKESTSYDFNFLKLNGSMESLGVYALPTTFIYNEKGERVKEVVGVATWDSKEMIDTLKEI